MAEWKNGKIVEWHNSSIAEWKNGRMIFPLSQLSNFLCMSPVSGTNWFHPPDLNVLLNVMAIILF